MRNHLRTTLRTTALLAFIVIGAASIADAQVSFNISIGPPPPPPVVRVYHPPRPAAGYVWIGGYWYPVGNHYKWHNGYWARPPYSGAYWVAPRHASGRYYYGYWNGRRGRYDDRGHRYDHYDRYDGHDREHR